MNFKTTVDKEKPLTGYEYIVVPIVTLVRHPDYNLAAAEFTNKFLKMTSDDLMELGRIILTFNRNENGKNDV